MKIEPRREKTGLQGFRPGRTQIGLCSHRGWLEAWNFGLMWRRNFTIRVAKKGADQLCSNLSVAWPTEVQLVFFFGSRFSVMLFGAQDPVVQSIVSLTILLRHKFVKQISAKVTNTLLFFVEKNVILTFFQQN